MKKGKNTTGITESQLRIVAYENWRNLPGATPEELEAIGYSSPESLESDMAGVPRLVKALAQISIDNHPNKVQGVFCGDCLTKINPGNSCDHIKVDKNGNSKIVG